MARKRSVSIVVLTYGKLEYTQRCFECIEENTEDYQLVVVDNASPDDTPRWLTEYARKRRNVEIILSKENLGFAGGCNRGVLASKHRTICLLNNDTEPHTGWLDALEAVFTPDVGAVGSKLLLPDGTIQHAGIEFKPVAGPEPVFWPYHRFLKEPQDLPEANVLEEVPAVTAACLLTNKMIWNKLGGMDVGYRIANFEDVDFNLAVRAAGLKVLYQPESVLIHHWGTTMSAQQATGPNTPGYWFRPNFRRLMTKWSRPLADGLATVPGRAAPPLPEVDPLPDGKLRIVMTLGRYSQLTGSELYIYELSRELASLGHDVTIISDVGGELLGKTRANGVQVHDWAAWDASRVPADVLHLNHIQPSQQLLAAYPAAGAIMSIHSELDFETPLESDRIHTYVCIRPEVARHVVEEHGIAEDRTSVVYNPVDFSRFHADDTPPDRSRKRVLFVGTIDPFRATSILDLVCRSQEEGFDLRIVGQRHAEYLDGVDLPNVTIEPPTWDIERHVRECDETAGVLLGRTTIEGWACGKPGWIYDVDDTGAIVSRTLHQPPADMHRFDSRLVAEQMVALYHAALGR